MSNWNPELYLKFEQQRTRPSIDLCDRVRDLSPRTVVDIGCGPGNSTAVLRKAFPHAELLGIDSSPEMIKKAQKNYPGERFVTCAAQQLQGEYDLLFSNACLQWIPNHDTLLPQLLSHLTQSGTLAVQIPMNLTEPLFVIIRQVAASGRWDFTETYFEQNETLTPEAYHRILCGCAGEFELWEQVYYHEMPDHASLLDWVRSTRLRPYLAVLSCAEQAEFEAEILQQVKQAYPLTARGTVILKFRRFFFTARRK